MAYQQEISKEDPIRINIGDRVVINSSGQMRIYECMAKTTAKFLDGEETSQEIVADVLVPI